MSRNFASDSLEHKKLKQDILDELKENFYYYVEIPMFNDKVYLDPNNRYRRFYLKNNKTFNKFEVLSTIHEIFTELNKSYIVSTRAWDDNKYYIVASIINN